MCQIATFYEQCPPLHIPSPKSNYFSDETKRRTKRTDFGQSNFALSNVRALRAKIFKMLYLRAQMELVGPPQHGTYQKLWFLSIKHVS